MKTVIAMNWLWAKPKFEKLCTYVVLLQVVESIANMDIDHSVCTNREVWQCWKVNSAAKP